MEDNLNLLNKVYSYTESCSKNLNYLLPHATDPSFRKAIISQINNYDKINSESKSEIFNLGKNAPKNTFLKFFNKVATFLNAANCSSDSSLAQLIIKESRSTIKEITKQANKNNKAYPTCFNLARKLIKDEQENIENIKLYL